MYTYTSALAMPRTIGAQWQAPDVQNIMLRELFAKYREIFLTVDDSFTEDPLYVELNQIKVTHAGSDLTVKEWLLAMNGLPLPTVEELPDAKIRYARYSNAVMAGYKVLLTNRGFQYPENYPHPRLVDLALTRPKIPTDMRLIHSHCLVTVNGYFHRTDSDMLGEQAYIVQGGYSSATTHSSHVGILSFLDIGEVKKVGLVDEDIIPLTPDTPLQDGIKFTVDEDLTGKTCLLSLGGYLVRMQDGIFYQAGDNAFGLNLRGLPYLERFMESRKQLDLSSMGVEVDDNGDDSYYSESLWSDEVIRKYLLLSQTFLIIVDTKELMFEEFTARVSNLPGYIAVYQEPIYPLFMNFGKCIEYAKEKEAYAWALRIADPYYKQFVLSQTPNREQEVVTSHVMPDRPYIRSQGYLLEISGYAKP